METQQTEHKKSFGKEVIISLVAFANTDGGRVIVGIDDSEKVCGINIGPETIQRYLNEIKTSTYPQIFPKIHTRNKDNHSILIFEISEFPIKPVSYKNRYYKQIHNSNHMLTLEEIVDLQQQSLSISYDAYPSETTLDKLNHRLIEHFFDLVNKRGRITLHEALLTNLIKLKLIREKKVTLAANLLFGDHDFTIRIGRFKSASTIIDDNVVKAPLLTAIDEAMIVIKKHINLAYHFDGSIQRKERWQYPLEALRELLLNAVVHRDYKNFSDIIIKIFDNRIIFTNPGRLYGHLHLADLERDDYVSSLRNKLLAEVFYLTGDIERYGTGFVRIRDFLKAYPEITLSIEEKGDFFWTELRIAESPTKQATPQVTPQVIRLLQVMDKPHGRRELQRKLSLRDREHFRKQYLKAALEAELIAMCNPDNPKAADQKYRLTRKGQKFVNELDI